MPLPYTLPGINYHVRFKFLGVKFLHPASHSSRFVSSSSYSPTVSVLLCCMFFSAHMCIFSFLSTDYWYTWHLLFYFGRSRSLTQNGGFSVYCIPVRRVFRFHSCIYLDLPFISRTLFLMLGFPSFAIFVLLLSHTSRNSRWAVNFLVFLLFISRLSGLLVLPLVNLSLSLLSPAQLC